MKKLMSAANNYNDSAYQQTGLDNLSDSEKGYLERAVRKMYELSDTINRILH